MFRNQYLAVATGGPAKTYPDCNQVAFGSWTIHLFHPLRAATLTKGGVEAILIGLAVDPLHPARTLDEILAHLLAAPTPSLAAIEAGVQGLSGRFVVAANMGAKTYVWGDACHLRQILYGAMGGTAFFGSSEKTILHHFDQELRMSEAKRRFMSSSRFKKSEDAWVGDQAHDDRIFRLLPNHTLSFPGAAVARRDWHRAHIPVGEADILAFCSSLLKGAFEALVRSHRLVQAITAGWDSRVLLAASMGVKDQIQYFIFNRGDPGTGSDAVVAGRLSRILGLRFEEIATEPLAPDFIEVFSREHLFPRFLSKTANIQHHYRQPDRERLVNINGNGGEIARSYYGLPTRFQSMSMACHLVGHPPREPFVRAAIEPWYVSAKAFSATSGVPLLDLLYWEQRMGNWGAQTPFEQDISNEEISPYNNSDLILALLSTSPSQRCAPNFSLSRRLAEVLCPKVLEVPVNPDSSKVRKMATRYGLGSYGLKLVKHEVLERVRPR